MERRVRARGQWQDRDCEAGSDAERQPPRGENLSFLPSLLLLCPSLTFDPHVLLLPPLNLLLFSTLTTIGPTQRNLQDLLFCIFLCSTGISEVPIFCRQPTPRSSRLNSTAAISIPSNPLSLKKVLNGQGRNPRFSIPQDTSKTMPFTLTKTMAVALNEHHHDPEHNHLQSLWPPRLLNCNLSYGFACKQLEMMDPGYVYTLSNLFKNLCFS